MDNEDGENNRTPRDVQKYSYLSIFCYIFLVLGPNSFYCYIHFLDQHKLTVIVKLKENETKIPKYFCEY